MISKLNCVSLRAVIDSIARHAMRSHISPLLVPVGLPVYLCIRTCIIVHVVSLVNSPILDIAMYRRLMHVYVPIYIFYFLQNLLHKLIQFLKLKHLTYMQKIC